MKMVQDGQRGFSFGDGIHLDLIGGVGHEAVGDLALAATRG